MRCPSCYSEETRVVDSRLGDNGDSVRRRRECRDCRHRFTTFERVFLDQPRVLKSDGRREAWNSEKLRRGILRALEKRSVGLDQLEGLVSNITKTIRLAGEREVTSKQIGKEVMEGLRNLDEVAYIRYASVYLSFQDVAEFSKEVERFQLIQNREGDSQQLSLLNFIRRTRTTKK
tara:strand:- start:4141 stop:4665 length:525 start_codon:yes stop_codon:yes gene_type:complete